MMNFQLYHFYFYCCEIRATFRICFQIFFECSGQTQQLKYMQNVAGVVFGDYDEQQKLQRHASMVVLRSLGYGKKSIENKILEEADHLVASFKVS